MLICSFCNTTQIADTEEAIEHGWEPEAYLSATSQVDIGPICFGCMSLHFHRDADGLPVANRTAIVRTGFFGTSFIFIPGDN